MTYAAPVADIAFALRHAAGLANALESGLYGDDLSGDVTDAILEEAGKYASDVIAPLNALGDRHGTPFKDGRVTMPPGFKQAYPAGPRPAGTASPARPSTAARRCLPSSMRHAPRCGRPRPWASASARC